MLEVRELSFSYQSDIIINGINLVIKPGKIIGLIGANGAGKTTILKSIMGFLTPSSGKIRINEVETNNSSISKASISYIPDTPFLYEELTVKEHLDFLTKAYGSQVDESYNLMRRFKLAEHCHKIPSQLSKGNKQKLMILCALIRQYNYLLADEPFDGLDPEQINIFKCELVRLKETKKGILLSTHLLNIVEDICDEYIIIDKGRVIFQGTLEDLSTKFDLASDSVEEIYLSIFDKDMR